MDRARVWPSFRAEHVLFEDDDLLFVHKPAGVASQAADPERPDDLHTRLRLFLAERRDAAPEHEGSRRLPYLGVHQRLDRDTSGVVVFAKRPEINAGLAKVFEGRAVEKRYLAVVTGWPARVSETTLTNVLRRGEGGLVEVVGEGARAAHAGRTAHAGRGRAARAPTTAARRDDRRSAHGEGGQRAVTHVRVLGRVGDRALLELRLETGRMHQARVQLAHAGAPIAGCALYGGAVAPRLMLHAASLTFTHPRTGKRLVVRDDRTTALERWLERGDLGAGVYDDDAALDDALALALERRWGLGRSADFLPEEQRTTAFRLVSDAGDALAGLAVDVYDGHLVAQFYVGDTWDDARTERVLDRLAGLGFDGVYVKRRPRQSNVLVDTRSETLAPAHAVRGNDAPDPLVIHEEGLSYRVSLGDGMSTGIFLDQRRNRALVRSLAKDRRVANLFAYTCGFSVAAAAGGARRTVSVDASVAALERGRENFRQASLAVDAAGRDGTPKHAFVAEDAFAWLARRGRSDKESDRFDLVVLDPPSYSSTKKRRFSAESDYGDLVTAALGIVAENGQIVACCNHRGLSRTKFRRMVLAGVRAAGRELVQLKDLPDGADFPPPFGQEPHMKSVLVKVI